MLEFFLYYNVKVWGFLVRLLPIDLALAWGRLMGRVAYFLDVKHKYRVYVNLKIAFAGTKSLPEIRQITYKLFLNFGQNIVELLRLPLMTRDACQKYIRVEGKEHLEAALGKGKGVILLAMHYGSWEMANLAAATLERPYKVIVNPQDRFPKLDALLNHYRECGGAVTIAKGMAARDFIRSLKNNELVGIVMDQGGKEGTLVPFFDRQASMAVGAIRVGLKLDVPVCFVVIAREKGPYHRIIIHPPLPFEKTGSIEDDVRRNMLKVTRLMEEYIRKNPAEYMWFYKIWKYSNEVVVTILNDGRAGHLRQSQAVADLVAKGLAEDQGVRAQIRTWDIVYRGSWAARLVSMASLFVDASLVQRRLGFLSKFLTPESFNQIMSMKADFIISCGSRTAAVNYLLAEDQQAKSIVILKPGILSFNRFDLVILPQHDFFRRPKTHPAVLVTQGAPNLISPEYLTQQKEEFVSHFTHLGIRDKITLGVLIGGDHKYLKLTEQRVRMVVHQILEAAEELDAEILATTSRRTSTQVENMLQRELKKSPRCPLLIVANRANVPQAMGGILALSDILVVSGDSISMVSEAASSGKKTVVFPLQKMFDFSPEKYKHDRFLAQLQAQGFILISEPAHIRSAIGGLAKNKIQLKTLNDQQLIYERLKTII